ncbi:molybdopterin-guanine dinucleotide biosynthesis protein B [Pyrobaculum sp. 3827-6]|uniref:molybdopterin-guanine dinucleotide biosynthesis protein B n=1 Tax=Pyrobaculum sp. 3827-6 TaxID=2983604 RepID=UPI0021D9D7FE|nr:molybdopterin-guanine dinucleotide biosynthesis protein B [Pyrobaculum sp. 3827-6]MCU7788840.1 molybdopterin-guanine dinucleotide biosynthesis protein B [Pyrobaculum sp. 3827-6]
MTCVIQLTGGKDVGKTALAEKIIAKLKEKGYAVAAIKISHHDPEPPTKDTHRLRRAGADKVLFYNGEIYVLYTRSIDCRDVDAEYVVVEGLRDKKVGYKIHIGPDPPPDADVVIEGPEGEVEVRCVEEDICKVLAVVATYRGRKAAD